MNYDHEDLRTDEERYNDRCNKADDDRNAARSHVSIHPYAGRDLRPTNPEPHGVSSNRDNRNTAVRDCPVCRTNKAPRVPKQGLEGLRTLFTLIAISGGLVIFTTYHVILKLLGE